MNNFRLLSLAAVLAGIVFVSGASAQNVSVASGNGQVLGGGNFILQPMVVQVTDAVSGLPVGTGVSVNWQFTGFNGFFLSSGTPQTTTSTDPNGLATAYLQLPANAFYQNVLSPIVQSSISASAGGNTALFTVTQLASAPNLTLNPLIQVVPINIPSGTTLTGAVGTASSIQIQLQVAATNGLSYAVVPNAAVQLLNFPFTDPNTGLPLGPLVACAANLSSGAGLNTVLTDANGYATCTPVFGNQPGTGRFIVTVGGVYTAQSSPAGFFEGLTDPTDPNSIPPVAAAWFESTPINVRETPGAAGSIKIISPTGGAQTVTAGGAVSFTVETDNTAGLPLSAGTVNWKIVSPASGANLSSATTTSGTNGQTSNSVTISTAFFGTVTVTATLASDPTKSVTFTVSVAPPVTVTQFQLISGSNQSAVVNGPFAQPLVVKVSTTAGPGANIPVQFAVLSGSISLSAYTVNTDSNGLAQVTATANFVTGPVSVVASLPGVSINTVSFALTVLPVAPVITSSNFVNGADFQPNSLSPCGIGALITSSGTLGVSGTVPPFPGGPVVSSPVQVSFASIPAPILNIGNSVGGQQEILFQVPCEVAPAASVPVTISAGGAVSNVNLAVNPAAPGVFQTQMSDGVLRTLAVRPDGSYVGLANPARLGETVVVYVTGLGVTTPGVSTHSLPAPGGNATVLGNVLPGIGNGGSAPLISARLSEDIPGVYVVAFQVPPTAPTGNDVPFSIGVIPPGASSALFSGLSKLPVHQ